MVLFSAERQWRSNFILVLQPFSNSNLADIIVILVSEYRPVFGRRTCRRFYLHVLCMVASVYKAHRDIEIDRAPVTHRRRRRRCHPRRCHLSPLSLSLA